MKTILHDDRSKLDNFGLFHLNLYDAAEIIIKSLWAEEITGEQGLDLFGIDFRHTKQEDLKDVTNVMVELLENAVNIKTLPTKLIRRSLEGILVKERTYVYWYDLLTWLEERQIEFNGTDILYEEAEQLLQDKALEFIISKRKKKFTTILDLENLSFDIDAHELWQDYQAVMELNDKLREQINKFNDEKPVSDRSKTTYLNVIGSLLHLLLGSSSSGKPYSDFRSQEAIIDAIHGNFPDKRFGLGKRTLEQKFALAKKSLENA